MKNRLVIIAAILSMTLSLGGCFVYKIDIQQGNEITEQMVASLELGMTKREVTLLLGYPLINDPFHKERWDYYYSHKTGMTGEVVQQLASLKFAEDKLIEIKSSFGDSEGDSKKE